VGYRRPRSAADDARRWRSFRLDHEALFDRAGLPGLLDVRNEFVYFLEHGYVPMPEEAITSASFEVEELDEAQRAALRALIAAYDEEFGDAVSGSLAAFLAPKPR
jgi:hypothetical protein